MILYFKSADQYFMADLKDLKWALVSDPTATGEVLDHGELKPQGMMVYTMYPRTKKDGLCTFGVTCVPLGGRLTIFLKANKEAGLVSEFSLPVPITEIVYRVME